MISNFLVTFEINGATDYWWFDTVEELKEEVEILKNQGAVILEAIQILESKEIEL